MSASSKNDLDRLHEDLSVSESASTLAELLPRVYDELRSLSEAYLRSERDDHTLQATALVHEAYMRLAQAESVTVNDREHFFRLAARTMRRILIDHAEKQGAMKRGGGRAGVALSETAALGMDREVDLLDLDHALERLADVGEQKARIVELRFFGGCTIDETAEALGISTATVERDWRFARAWLRSRLEEGG